MERNWTWTWTRVAKRKTKNIERPSIQEQRTNYYCCMLLFWVWVVYFVDHTCWLERNRFNLAFVLLFMIVAQGKGAQPTKVLVAVSCFIRPIHGLTQKTASAPQVYGRNIINDRSQVHQFTLLSIRFLKQMLDLINTGAIGKSRARATIDRWPPTTTTIVEQQ